MAGEVNIFPLCYFALMCFCVHSVDCRNTDNDCVLSENGSYKYKNDGKEVEPGTKIYNGTTIIVSCKSIKIESYDYNGGNELLTKNITCRDGILSDFDLQCDAVVEEKRDKCLVLENGNVIKLSHWTFKVSCNDKYEMNLFYPDSKCTCKNDTLICEKGGQTPQCKPASCALPETIDFMMTVQRKENSNWISLSGSLPVNHEDLVYVDCLGGEGTYMEPAGRRFKCKKGSWEADERADWKFNNNGSFPKCRATNCGDIGCRNGGACVRDNVCKCLNGTIGHNCEKLIVDTQRCLNLINGLVHRLPSKKLYTVSCNDSYELNLLKKNNKCICTTKGLLCGKRDRHPKCKPVIVDTQRCLNLINGLVHRLPSKKLYTVSCNDSYELNLLKKNNKCICTTKGLLCGKRDRHPKCKPGKAKRDILAITTIRRFGLPEFYSSLENSN